MGKRDKTKKGKTDIEIFVDFFRKRFSTWTFCGTALPAGTAASYACAIMCAVHALSSVVSTGWSWFPGRRWKKIFQCFFLNSPYRETPKNVPKNKVKEKKVGWWVNGSGI
jgi:hypothetical protein